MHFHPLECQISILIKLISYPSKRNSLYIICQECKILSDSQDVSLFNLKVQCSFFRYLRKQAKNAQFFLKLCHISSNQVILTLQIVKSRIASLYMIFKSIIKNSQVSHLAETQGCPLAFVQVLRIFQLY